MSIQFGGNDDRLDCGSSASVDNIWDSGGALSCWVYDAGAQGGNLGRIFSKWDVDGWASYIDSNANVIVFEQAFDGAQDGGWTIPRPAQNTWWHLVVNYDSGATANDPDMYVNAVLQNETEVKTPSGGSARISDAGETLSIGNIAAEVRGLNGQLEDCRLFPFKLSAPEITTLTAGYRGPIGGEVLWLDMESVEAETVATVVGKTTNKNNGSPQNGLVYKASKAPRYG